MERLSIVIPVYNEEKSIEDAINFFKILLGENPDTEVIFVNDGSTDKTSQVLDALRHEKMKVINQPKNKGYGAAIKTGIKYASYEYIAITDADGSYPNERIPELFKTLFEKKSSIVIGARVGEIVQIGIFRRFGKYLLRKFAEFLSEEHIPDLNSGLRIVKKDLVIKFQRFLSNRFSFTSTLTLSLLANNYEITYVPINYYKRKGKSKIKPIRDTLNFLQLIIRTVMFFNPLKVFLPLSLLFMALSIAVLLISYFLGQVMDITTILLFSVGLNFLAVGLLADLIDKRLKE